MSTLGGWLDARLGDAPQELSESIAGGLEPAEATTVAGALGEAAAVRLTQARRLGNSRSGAFHLLAADALVTYACEAALDTEDVEAELLRVLEIGTAP